MAYGDHEHKDVIESLAEWARAVMPGYHALSLVDYSDDHARNALVRQSMSEMGMRILAESVDAASARLKPIGFRGEREVRAIVHLDEANEHVRLRPNEHGVVQYVRVASRAGAGPTGAVLPYDLRDRDTRSPTRSLPVTGLTVGPTPYFAQSLPALYAALRRADLSSVHPKKSEAPLRW